MLKYAIAAILLMLSLTSCAIVSMQNKTATYNSDRLFEHCFALDFQNANVEKKLNCWIEWIMFSECVPENYKVEYAYKRINEILNGKN